MRVNLIAEHNRRKYRIFYVTQTKGGDIYIGTISNISHSLKFSIHKSGQCHLKEGTNYVFKKRLSKSTIDAVNSEGKIFLFEAGFNINALYKTSGFQLGKLYAGQNDRNIHINLDAFAPNINLAVHLIKEDDTALIHSAEKSYKDKKYKSISIDGIKPLVLIIIYPM